MSYPTTTPAYLSQAKGAGRLSRELPVLDFLIDHQEAFDHGNMKNEPYIVIYTDDFVFTKSDGTVLPPGEATWRGWLEGCAAFNERFHDARYACIYERNGGWEMLGFAHLYANFLVPGAKTKKDSTGRLWDVYVPGSLVFTCVKDPAVQSDLRSRVKTMTLYGDGTSLVGEMVKRGMLKPEDLFN